MGIIIEILIAFFAAGGLLGLGWLIFGRLLSPVGGRDGGKVLAVVPAKGGGETLEHDVTGLLWLQAGGMAEFRIVIADGGLDEQGLAVASALLERDSEICFCRRGELEEIL